MFCTWMQHKEVARSERTVHTVQRASDRALLTQCCAKSIGGVFGSAKKQANALQEMRYD